MPEDVHPFSVRAKADPEDLMPQSQSVIPARASAALLH